jgi:hypothetical protein
MTAILIQAAVAATQVTLMRFTILAADAYAGIN